MDSDNLKAKALCNKVKQLCAKLLDKSDFLLFVNNNAAHAVRTEILGLNADVNITLTIFEKGFTSEDGEDSLFICMPDKVGLLLHRLDACEHYVRTAVGSTRPDPKATKLANLLCQVPCLVPSAMLFNVVVRELQQYRWSVTQALKNSISSRFDESDPLFSGKPSCSII